MASVETDNVPQPSPYKNLVSSLNSASFSESEIQKLFEIISKKAGKDSWQLVIQIYISSTPHQTPNTCLFCWLSYLFYSHLQASQKGDPLAALKKQLEEKDKQLTAEQGNVAAAKTRVKELTKVTTASMHG